MSLMVVGQRRPTICDAHDRTQQGQKCCQKIPVNLLVATRCLNLRRSGGSTKSKVLFGRGEGFCKTTSGDPEVLFGGGASMKQLPHISQSFFIEPPPPAPQIKLLHVFAETTLTVYFSVVELLSVHLYFPHISKTYHSSASSSFGQLISPEVLKIYLKYRITITTSTKS